VVFKSLELVCRRNLGDSDEGTEDQNVDSNIDSKDCAHGISSGIKHYCGLH
jgi:hypothetical protein